MKTGCGMEREGRDDTRMLSFLATIQPGRRSDGAVSDWVLGMTLEGRSHELHPGGDFSQEPFDVIAIPANTSHHWMVPDASGPWTTLYFIFRPRPSLLVLLRQLPEIRPGIMKLPLAASPVRGKARAALLRAHRLLNSPWPNRVELAMNALEGALLWCQAELGSARTSTDPRVQKAVAYLLRRLAGPVYLEELAKACALSVPRLETLFKERVGLTPMAFLESERMERARELLVSSQYPVKMVAGLAGYDDPVYFAKRFAKHFHASPSRGRQPCSSPYMAPDKAKTRAMPSSAR